MNRLTILSETRLIGEIPCLTCFVEMPLLLLLLFPFVDSISPQRGKGGQSSPLPPLHTSPPGRYWDRNFYEIIRRTGDEGRREAVPGIARGMESAGNSLLAGERERERERERGGGGGGVERMCDVTAVA